MRKLLKSASKCKFHLSQWVPATPLNCKLEDVYIKAKTISLYHNNI